MSNRTGFIKSSEPVYKNLDFDKLLSTIARLRRRIEERFPESRLKCVSSELIDMAEKSRTDVHWIKKPNKLLRAAVGLIILLTFSLIGYSWQLIDINEAPLTQITLITMSESIFNNLILAGAGTFFLLTLETRIKRSRVLRSLHHLREMAHVIDMLQLTKDPYFASGRGISTESSPERTMTIFELQRYLDYCSETLSLVGKLSALYAQHFPDQVVTSAVNEVELLCSSLSNKIWQKIMIANNLEKSQDISSDALQQTT